MRAPALLIALYVLGMTTSAPGAGQPVAPEKPASTDKPFRLMVGDPAPGLTVSRWLKGTPVESFRKGTVYVVDFWATWCGPCRRSIPHLTALQKQYKGKVTVIGVCIWEPNNQASVEPFVRDKGESMDYSVAVDKVPNPSDPLGGRTAVDWMNASGKNEYGIPTAFIIDGSARVAWVGPPRFLDQPLARIVSGRWDMKAEAARYRQRAARWSLSKPVLQRLKEASSARDWPGIIKACDELVDLDGQLYGSYALTKFQVLLLGVKDVDGAYAFGRKAVDSVLADDSELLRFLAAIIVDPQVVVSKRDLDLALKAGQRSVQLTHERDPDAMATLARACFLKGEAAKAVEWQQKAIVVADRETKPTLEKTLAEYSHPAGGEASGAAGSGGS